MQTESKIFSWILAVREGFSRENKPYLNSWKVRESFFREIGKRESFVKDFAFFGHAKVSALKVHY